MFMLSREVLDSQWLKWAAAGAAGVGIVLVLRRYTGGARCSSKQHLRGKTVIITGANCGLGKATAIELVKREARVILACRDPEKAKDAAKDISRSAEGKGEVVVHHLDLASLKSVREFCKGVLSNESRIDILINNAGVYQCPYTKTEDGFENQMGVNHLGHFYLTNLLLRRLKGSALSRVIIISSGLSKFGKIDVDNLNMTEANYDKKAGYNNSKLANDLFARELSERVAGSGVGVYCLSPGMVWSSLGRHVSYPMWMWVLLAPIAFFFVKTAYEGSQTIVHCAVEEKLKGESGKFYRNCQQVAWQPHSVNESLGRKLWEASEQLTSLHKDIENFHNL